METIIEAKWYIHSVSQDNTVIFSNKDLKTALANSNCKMLVTINFIPASEVLMLLLRTNITQ